jgi:hypothetical protein
MWRANGGRRSTQAMTRQPDLRSRRPLNLYVVFLMEHL